MSTLIIDNKTLSISQQGECIKIKKDNANPYTIPISHVSRVAILCNIPIETRLLRTLATKAIDVAFINPRKPEEYGLLQGSGHKDISRKIQQLTTSQNPQICQLVSYHLIHYKIQRQIQNLISAKPQKQVARYKIVKALGTLKIIHEKISQQKSIPISTLRGFEGSAAAAYFSAYTQLFAQSFNFTHRNRRPPKDPVNALLSLSYTLLDSLASQRIYIQGFDPKIGYYHQTSYGRNSFSSDLIEPARPLIDEWVRDMTAKQKIRNRDFKQQGEGVLLKKSARSNFFKHWETEMKFMAIKELDQQLKHIKNMIGISHD
jgi:CRISP-associated protein Cas1